jgi:hypothetical protein
MILGLLCKCFQVLWGLLIHLNLIHFFTKSVAKTEKEFEMQWHEQCMDKMKERKGSQSDKSIRITTDTVI